jgi:hypothetical protein
MSAATKYRKKPVVIEAEGPLHTGNIDRIAKWCGGRIVVEAKRSHPTDVYRGLDIPTLEDVMRANLGDYIIRGVQGEFYPCKPDIFEATYELVSYD